MVFVVEFVVEVFCIYGVWWGCDVEEFVVDVVFEYVLCCFGDIGLVEILGLVIFCLGICFEKFFCSRFVSVFFLIGFVLIVILYVVLRNFLGICLVSRFIGLVFLCI